MTNEAIVSRPALRAAMSLACKVAEKRNALPILSSVAIFSSLEGLRVQATDLDLMATFTLPGTLSDDDFAVAIPAHLVRDIEKKAPVSEDVTICSDPSECDAMPTALSFGKVNFRVHGLPLTDWPELEISGKINADIPADRRTFLDALEFCQGAISTEETRCYLNGIYMHRATNDAGEPVLRMVATDGHRLRLRDIPEAAVSGDFSGMPGVIVPRKTVAFLIDVLKRKSAPDTVQIIVNCTKCRFVSGEVDTLTKLIDGTFPDYQRVIPLKNDRLLDVDRDELAEAIKAVTCVSSERGRAVKFAASEEALRLEVNNPDSGWADTTIAAGWSGDEMEIGFNATYVLAELAELPAGRITFAMRDSASPTLIYSGAERGESFSVIMPLRV